MADGKLPSGAAAALSSKRNPKVNPPKPTQQILPTIQEPGREIEQDVPQTITDVSTKTNYIVGRFLGKGGFARCYEVKDANTNEQYACKVVSKKLLVRQHQREKMAQEISIHRELQHEYIVKFHSFFEDDLNVYCILELCNKKSLMELQKRRRVITEPEARYFMEQMMSAVLYLHDRKVIHRDLKLGNIFINHDLKLKLGDFGLATQCEKQCSKRFTLCGTPNYIAPEVLVKKGHSFEVDIWSTGCILYTLLVGKPPFETNSLRDTYSKIKKGEYMIPTGKISAPARNLITRMLQLDPSMRPTARQILHHDFMTNGFIPKSLPHSVLTMPPRFARNDEVRSASSSKGAGEDKRNPLMEQNQRIPGSPSAFGTVESSKSTPTQQKGTVKMLQKKQKTTEHFMRSLRTQLSDFVESITTGKTLRYNYDSEDPNSAPLLWISKWVDYSDKYGFGYQLSDDSIGVSFNDMSKMILLPDNKNLQYIDKHGVEFFYDKDEIPEDLIKKMKLLDYFQQYMVENLQKAGGMVIRPDYSLARLPSLWTWFRTSRAVVMILTNGTLQINNFQDHSKTLYCPLLSAVTILENNQQIRTFRFDLLKKYGSTSDLVERARYAIEKLNVVLDQRGNQPIQTNPPMNRPSSRQ